MWTQYGQILTICVLAVSASSIDDVFVSFQKILLTNFAVFPYVLKFESFLISQVGFFGCWAHLKASPEDLQALKLQYRMEYSYIAKLNAEFLLILKIILIFDDFL